MKRLFLPLLLCLCPVFASAEVFQIEDIRLDGLQRVSAGTVFASLPVHAGDLIDDEGIRVAVRTLFKSGYFDDISVAREGKVLVVSLKERPAVAEINIDGNKAIETPDLLNALRDSGLAEGQIFRQTVLEGMSSELRRQYVSQGRYGATVISEIEVLPRNRVAVNLTIDEGKVASIKHINVVGNQVFDDEALLGLFELKTTGMLSWIFSDDKYSREKLSGDLERLESWYLDRGYLQFAIDSTQVTISPDRDAVFVTVNISEGDVYTVSEVELAGELILPEKFVRLLILTRPGMTFSQSLMTSTTDIMIRRLGADGYTFAEVEAYPDIDEEEKTAKITYFVTPGKRSYVRRIEFRGNTKTDDEVLRREMRQMEGASASNSLLERSKVRLERLSYFKQVDMETREVPGTDDQLDVFYTVEEQPSGSVGASLGVAQGSGIILGGNISESNFFGTGNSVTLGLSSSTYRDSASLSFNNPYFTKDGVSAGYRLAFTSTDYGEFDVADYTTDSLSTSVNFGYPLSETSRISLGFGYEQLELDVGLFPTLEILQFIRDNGDNYKMITSTLNWSQSTLNRGVLATRGASQRAGVEFSTPIGDMEYLKFSYSGQYFHPITRSLTLHLKTDLGYGIGLGDTDRLPFFKNYYGGGFGSVRGFKRNTLGPQDTPFPGFDDSDAFGGNVKITGSAEVIFPVPFMKDNRSVQAAVFVDAGNIFDTDCNQTQANCFSPEFGELRYSVGIGGTWLSGFGPITVALARGMNDGEFDETEFFQFSLGQGF
ncbi:MAG: outer membrane protein assembly factor BamA [Gammaproteobacteria bacterium]|nr:outer membrane protein assembly factor BamA [Gammaproteobacteria bacterium]MBQ0839006.1 outer membrane protein assembly factor BamA [Gammaproteobacteria bacterium]